MFEIRYVNEQDKKFWFSLDNHMSNDEFLFKVRDKRGYIISNGEKPIGIMRYNLFGDNTPFLNLIHLEDSYHGKGFGKQAMKYWEDEMKNLGYKLVMTSTQADEQAQHFYRKLGYVDSGCIIFKKEPTELFFIKYFEE